MQWGALSLTTFTTNFAIRQPSKVAAKLKERRDRIKSKMNEAVESQGQVLAERIRASLRRRAATFVGPFGPRRVTIMYS